MVEQLRGAILSIDPSDDDQDNATKIADGIHRTFLALVEAIGLDQCMCSSALIVKIAHNMAKNEHPMCAIHTLRQVADYIEAHTGHGDCGHEHPH